MESPSSVSKKKSSYHPDTFVAYLEHLEKFADQPALKQSDGNYPLNFTQLVSLAKSKAAWLRTEYSPGDRIIFDDLSGPIWVVHFFACMLAELVVVPLDKRMSLTLKSQIIKDTQPSLVLSTKKKFKTKSTRPNLKITNSVPTITFLKSPNMLACILYTSGTWGSPKGVMLTHQNLLHNLYAVTKAYIPKQGERFLSVLPLAHAYELMVGMLIPLYSGSQVIYQHQLDSVSLKKSFQKYQITTLVTVPRLLEIIHKSIIRQARENGKEDLLRYLLLISQYIPLELRRWLFRDIHKKLGPTLQTLVIGGAPLKTTDHKFFLHLGYRVLIGYGLTETSPVLTVCLKQHTLSGCVGQPINDLQLKIKDSEVLVQGSNVFDGYWPKKRKAHSWFRTGDIGYLDQQGNLRLKGRRKNTIIFSSGDKIDLETIEEIVESTPGVDEAGAINIGTTSQPVMALVAVSQKNAHQLKQIINAQLPQFAHLKKVIVTNQELPRTHTKKLNRAAIFELATKVVD